MTPQPDDAYLHIIETPQHLYLLKYSLGWRERGLDGPNDMQVKEVDGVLLTPEEEYRFLESMDQEEFDRLEQSYVNERPPINKGA